MLKSIYDNKRIEENLKTNKIISNNHEIRGTWLVHFKSLLTVIKTEYLYRANLILIAPNVGLTVVPINMFCTKFEVSNLLVLFVYFVFIYNTTEIIKPNNTETTTCGIVFLVTISKMKSTGHLKLYITATIKAPIIKLKIPVTKHKI